MEEKKTTAHKSLHGKYSTRIALIGEDRPTVQRRLLVHPYKKSGIELLFHYLLPILERTLNKVPDKLDELFSELFQVDKRPYLYYIVSKTFVLENVTVLFNAYKNNSSVELKKGRILEMVRDPVDPSLLRFNLYPCGNYYYLISIKDFNKKLKRKLVKLNNRNIRRYR